MKSCTIIIWNFSMTTTYKIYSTDTGKMSMAWTIPYPIYMQWLHLCVQRHYIRMDLFHQQVQIFLYIFVPPLQPVYNHGLTCVSWFTCGSLQCTSLQTNGAYMSHKNLHVQSTRHAQIKPCAHETHAPPAQLIHLFLYIDVIKQNSQIKLDKSMIILL